MFLVVALILLGGVKSIGKVSEKLVPFMTVGFVALSMAVICIRPQGAAQAVSLIFEQAFTLRSGMGGVGGFLMSGALRYGTMRGILSNEAGCGTAPTAHAVSDCKSPARQGVWGIFEVFVDTVLLCTLTALVIIISGGRNVGDDYMMMTVNAYTSVLGELAGGFIAVSVVLFGLATVLCWGHYGIESVKYLSGKKFYISAFIICYTLCVVLGAVLSGKFIWEAADFAIGGMTVINLCVLLCMSGEVRKETEKYFGKKK
jgi:AGCS family alanine or glycine:cation symporter